MSLATKITGNLPFSILHRNGISWTKVLVRGWFLLNLRLSEGLEITKVVAAAVLLIVLKEIYYAFLSQADTIR